MSKMPMMFIGHGSPMNAIEDNRFTRTWRDMVKEIPKPDSIVSMPPNHTTLFRSRWSDWVALRTPSYLSRHIGLQKGPKL